jgi:DNA (cytosine-5)-methyltransferase 1
VPLRKNGRVGSQQQGEAQENCAELLLQKQSKRRWGQWLKSCAFSICFSGIGGFSLGLERTGGFQTVAFCEIEPFPRKVLAKHWPGVPCYHDVRTLTTTQLSNDGIGPINVITGGFPCQDLSASGKKSGISGERSGLYAEVIRIACDIRPNYIAMENVANFLVGDRGNWFGIFLRDMASIGYSVEWFYIPASWLGAPHARTRVWIVAYPYKIGCAGLALGFDTFRQFKCGAAQNAWVSKLSPPEICRMDDGIPDRVDRLAALGNAVVPQISELIGRAILASLQGSVSV